MFLLHEFQNQLVIGLESSPMQLYRDPSIAITAFIFDTDLLYLIPFTVTFYGFMEMLQVIIITAPGDFYCYQEPFQWVFLP
jgi:hypothetical protein